MQSIEALAGELMTVPLTQLVASPLNVRTGDNDVEELAALIGAQGLMQNLTITTQLTKRGKPSGRYEVVAGGRRRRALLQLAAAGKLKADEPILCKLVAREKAVAASLAENSGRLLLSPADAFEAFQKLALDGSSVDDIATAFGVSPLTVQRRLKLARVAPQLIALYREGKATLEQLMALAVCDDQARQWDVWTHTAEWHREPYQLRRLLTEGELDAARDPLVKFVGLKAYEKAGGAVRRDLFADDEGGYIVDADLLRKLAGQKLAKEAEKQRRDGWAWTEVMLDVKHGDLTRFSRAAKARRQASDEEQAELVRLQGEEQRLSAQIDACYEAEDGEDVASDTSEKLSDLETQSEQIDAALQKLQDGLLAWTPEAKASAGALVSVNSAGRLEVKLGLVRPEDRKAAAQAAELAGDVDRIKPERAAHSDALLRTLSAHRTVALQNVVADHPGVALAALTHVMLQTLGTRSYPRTPSALAVRVEGCASRLIQLGEGGIETSRAWTELTAKIDAWGERIPGDDQAVLPWLMRLPMESLIELLALCTAASLDAVQDREGAHASDVLAGAVGLDMADWWAPSAAGYLARVSKARILEAVSEAVSAETAAPLAKLKKTELVGRAEALLAGKRWLPRPLRGIAAE